MSVSTAPEMLSIAARPYAFRFPRERTALVLIDVQCDFVDVGGFGEIQCGDAAVFGGVRAVVAATQPVLAAARALGLTVVHTREGHAPDLSDLSAAKNDRQRDAPGALRHAAGVGDVGPMGRLLVRGERGHGLVSELAPRPGEVVVDKPGKGAFWATTLHRQLLVRGITHLLVAGVTTECCVATTAREASDRGFQVCLLEDCTAGFEASFARASVDMFVSFGGLFGFAGCGADIVALAAEATAAAAEEEAQEAQQQGRVPDADALDITTLRAQYTAGRTPQAIINAVYDRIAAYEAVNPHAWILLRPRNDVLAEARALAAQYADVAHGDRPPLYGVPFAVKDSFDIEGLATTAACPAFAYTATATAPTAAAALAAGALLVGKTNMDQLATGLSGCRSPYGTSSSAWGPPGRAGFVSGGSSSGSAVAVGARLVTFALATDTAGSGRVPAAFNGVVGFKPTRGTLSYRGIVPCCRQLDTATVLAMSVSDARNIWHILDTHDAADAFAKPPGALPLPLADYRGVAGDGRAGGFVYAVPPFDVMVDAGLSPAYTAGFARSLGILEHISGGRTVRTLSREEYAPFAKATDLLYNGTLVNERIACIGPEFVRRNIASFHPTTRTLFQQVLDRNARPWDVFSDLHAQAEATRQAARLFSRAVGSGGGGVDVLVVPTAPFHPTIAAMEADPIAMNARLGVFTHFGNVLDLCAISVPAGVVSDTAAADAPMPFGLCFVCATGMDGFLFDVAAAFERAVQASGVTDKL